MHLQFHLIVTRNVMLGVMNTDFYKVWVQI